METQLKRWMKSLIAVLFLFTVTSSSWSQCAFEEVDGVVAIEAEDYKSQEKTNKRKWYIIGQETNLPSPDPDPAHTSGASGGKYLEILPDTRVGHSDPLIMGTNFTNTAGEMTVANYDVYFNTPGKYFVWARVYSTGSEDNGMHVGIDGTWPESGQRMQWCDGKNNWTWESKQRTNAVHCGVEQQIFLNVPTAGLHTVSISMREDGFELDKMVLSKSYTKPSGNGPAVKTRDCDVVDDNQIRVLGEKQRWHKITLVAEGPSSSETANPNPFMDYRLDATFTHSSGASYKVPGFYAACEDPTSGCNSGKIWMAHFTPDRPGVWSYSLEFKTGSNVAVGTGGTSAGFFDGKSGSFEVFESTKTGRDFRSKEKGKLRYVGEHYLRFAGTGGDQADGNYFVKAGADAPENTLAYNDFDGTPNRNNRRKSWAPHQQDYEASDASQYTWANGKGSELLGVVNYLSKKGVNAMSFLTMSLHGDDENVFPHLMKVGENQYNGFNDARQWADGVYHTRFDVSKLAQWEKVFSYADKKGVFLHFKTLENENDNLMDNDNLGNERKVYYRELVARFGHHLALNWNLGEESTISSTLAKQTANYINSIDPYDGHIVLHTYPRQANSRYTPLLGNASKFTGASLQTENENYSEIKGVIKEWLNKSADNNKKWVVCLDEPGSAQKGIDVDDNGADDKNVRDKVLWTSLLAGAMGVEYYYGYETGASDLTAQDHRTRDRKYTEAGYALSFFENYLVDKVINLTSSDQVTTDNSDHVLADAGNLYIVYRPNGGSTTISLPGSGWKVQWFNPRTGGAITNPQNQGGTLVAPSNNDWVAIVTKDGLTPVGTGNKAPLVSFTKPLINESFVEDADLGVLVEATDLDGSVVSVSLYLDGVLVREDLSAPFAWGTEDLTNGDNALLGLVAGSYQLKVVAKDNEGAESQASRNVTVQEKGRIQFTPLQDAYLQNNNGFNNMDLRVENGNRVTYLMFSSPDLTFVTVEEARLELTVGSDAGSGKISVFRGVGDSWQETNLSSNNAPMKQEELTFVEGSFSVGNTYSFDVSNYDFTGEPVVFIVEQTNAGNDVSFSSKESGLEFAPKLVFKTNPITSVDKWEGQEFYIYPNPSDKGLFHITQGKIWNVFTVGGKSILSGEGKIIDLSSFDKGIYYLQIDGTVSKIIKN